MAYKCTSAVSFTIRFKYYRRYSADGSQCEPGRREALPQEDPDFDRVYTNVVQRMSEKAFAYFLPKKDSWTAILNEAEHLTTLLCYGRKDERDEEEEGDEEEEEEEAKIDGSGDRSEEYFFDKSVDIQAPKWAVLGLEKYNERIKKLGGNAGLLYANGFEDADEIATPTNTKTKSKLTDSELITNNEVQGSGSSSSSSSSSSGSSGSGGVSFETNLNAGSTSTSSKEAQQRRKSAQDREKNRKKQKEREKKEKKEQKGKERGKRVRSSSTLAPLGRYGKRHKNIEEPETAPVKLLFKDPDVSDPDKSDGE
jgi:uncharacterized membrane protein YgcG